ncbi:MAG TPA: CBS domain-containing protein [Kofleriaceae bacterium]|nr:CBS domain-containing protein [Kofleriaceae bacterium]
MFEEEEVTRELETLASLARQPTIIVAPDTPIEDVRARFVDERAAAILVVDADENLMGILTRTDALRAEPGATARTALSSVVFVLPMFASVERAAALMAYENVGQIVLTDGDGALVGVVSAIDIVRHYAVESGYLVAD